MSELSDLLRGVAERDRVSARRRSDLIDGRLHFSTIAAYQRGDHPASPDESTLQALADAYRLPLDQLQAAAGVPVGAGPYSPPAEAARLTRRQQAAVTEIIMAMVEAQGGSNEDWQSKAEKTPLGDALARLQGDTAVQDDPPAPRSLADHKRARLDRDALPADEAAYDGDDPEDPGE